MRLTPILLLFILISCQKEETDPPVIIPETPVKKILLKDITQPGLPSPYYHFEYRADSLVSRVSVGAGFNLYDVVYNQGRIRDLRNNIIINHDTLRYNYHLDGQLATINLINDKGLIYKQLVFSFTLKQLTEIGFYKIDGHTSPILERKLTMTYHSDGNLKDLGEYRPAMGTVPEFIQKTTFELYDDKINVDDFTLLQDGFQDHIFLLPGIRIQKNNVLKSKQTGQVNSFNADFTYTYNTDNTPAKKEGKVTFTTGPQAGQVFNSLTNYTYY